MREKKKKEKLKTFLVIQGYTKVIFIIYIFIYNLETVEMKLQDEGSCGVIFQRLAHVLQIASPDRRGSPGPSHCRGSRRWPGSAARRGGPRRKAE